MPRDEAPGFRHRAEGTDLTLEFLTPLGGIFALCALLPLAALVLHERRLRRLRDALRVEQASLRSRLPIAIALAAIPLLLGVALTQPVIKTTRTLYVRTDAQAVYVVDVSRSMLASRQPEGRTRLDQARRAALRIRTALTSIPSGLASMTDRVIPHVFPTDDDEVFAAALAQSIRVGNPPPRGFEAVGTLFESLDALSGTNLFKPGIAHRLAVVLTDGESREYYVPTLRDALARGPRTDFVIVRLGDESDRVWNGRAPEAQYEPQQQSEQMVNELATITRGRAFEQGELGSAIGYAQERLGNGPVEERGETLRVISLARWIALASLVPLGFVLWRRNVV